jgi:orotate phosphoribosyltransferase
MYRDKQGWINVFEEKGAFWLHDGNPKRPHALLTSREHSSGFFNSRLVILDEALLRVAASDLLELFALQGGDVSMVEGVVGPQTGATKLAEFMSYQVMAHTRNRCFWASPAKSDGGGLKSMVFSDEDLAKLKGKTILLCEDVITTGDSVGLVATAVAGAGGIVLPFVLSLVNRSGLTEASGKKIVALIEYPMQTWTPEKCPLCKAGSEALRPKENWARLNARY